MKEPERARRPELERSAPIRHVAGLFGADETVAGALRAGYEVADRAIRRGLAAERPELPSRQTLVDLARQLLGAPTVTASNATELVLRLDAPRGSEVSVSLPGGAQGALSTHGLLAPPALGAPPITSVSLRVEAGKLHLHIAVPPGQPPGCYVGVLVDVAGAPRGTISLSFPG